MEEAAKNGYLNDGSEFCSNILKQNAKENDIPLAQYVPRGPVSKKKFCSQFDASMVDECSSVTSENSAEMTPAAELLHSADALDAPAMPHIADQSTPSLPVTNMVAASSTEEEQPSKMSKEYMKKNFGSILRFGGGSQ
jgi:hypothetical protein